MAEEKREAERDELAESLEQLFTSISAMIKSDLEGTNNQFLLLEKLNGRLEDEYSGFGDVAAGLRVFVEKLSERSRGFDDYVQQIDTIDTQVSELEVAVSMLDKYVRLLEKKVQSSYRISPT